MGDERGRMCERHERYVQPGEECPMCEPAGVAQGVPTPVKRSIASDSPGLGWPGSGWAWHRPRVPVVITGLRGEVDPANAAAEKAIVEAMAREPARRHARKPNGQLIFDKRCLRCAEQSKVFAAGGLADHVYDLGFKYPPSIFRNALLHASAEPHSPEECPGCNIGWRAPLSLDGGPMVATVMESCHNCGWLDPMAVERDLQYQAELADPQAYQNKVLAERIGVASPLDGRTCPDHRGQCPVSCGRRWDREVSAGSSGGGLRAAVEAAMAKPAATYQGIQRHTEPEWRKTLDGQFPPLPSPLAREVIAGIADLLRQAKVLGVYDDGKVAVANVAGAEVAPAGEPFIWYHDCSVCGAHLTGQRTTLDALVADHNADARHELAREAVLRGNVETARRELYDYLRSKGRAA